MQHFLYRLSKSEYQDKFIIKGGMLISLIIGIENRTTMDLDATLRNFPLSENEIIKAFNCICNIPSDDGILFTFSNIELIREDDNYGGYRVSFSQSMVK